MLARLSSWPRSSSWSRDLPMTRALALLLFSVDSVRSLPQGAAKLPATLQANDVASVAESTNWTTLAESTNCKAKEVHSWCLNWAGHHPPEFGPGWYRDRVAGKGPNVRERRGFRGAAQVPEHRVRASRVAQVRVDRPHRLLPEEGVVPHLTTVAAALAGATAHVAAAAAHVAAVRHALHLDRRLQLRGPAHEGHQAAHSLWRQPVPVRGADADQGS